MRYHQQKGLDSKSMVLLLFLGLPMPLFIGCAHNTSPPLPKNANGSVVTGPKKESSVSFGETTPPGKKVEDTAADDEFAFLDEEDQTEPIDVADPLFYWNKAMYVVNDKIYFWALKPVSQGYKTIVPKTIRIGVHNFFHNIAFPIRFVGCLLQAKGHASAGELSRFLVNTTWGVLGFGNPAKNYPFLNPSPEDPGQAFGRWGIGNGFYIVWPILGPSTLRDSIGLVGNYFLDPVTYVQPLEAAVGIYTYDVVNETSLKIGDYEAFKKGAVEPYTSMRDAYLQERQQRVRE